jgi:hypothetical protein
MRSPAHPWQYAVLLVLLPAIAPAADPPPPKGHDAAGRQFFEQKIRPVLVKHCYSCHSAEARKVRGGLLLDTREGMLKGGDSGPAVVPGKALSSLLIKAIRHDELAMPPKEKLPDAVVADFERWIKMGAPDPRGGKVSVAQAGIDIEAGRRFWAFQPVGKPAAPTVKDAGWPRGDVDRFILAGLEARGLRPVRDADRTTLIRRATIELIGLPPTPEEIDAFVADPSADVEAFARVVDRLLASPHYGERWGRHWLDVARYADSNGKDENLTFHESFRYRDYVIRSLNQDKPYNQFLMEQIAGDLMPAVGQEQKDEQLTGTGFLVVGPKVLADRDFLKRKMDVVDEQIDTVGRTFMALTLGCARCHDHKFDPIPTADYYALAGIFASTHTLDGTKLGNAVVSGWMRRPLGGPANEARLTAVKDHQAKLTALADAIKKVRADLKGHEDRASMRVAAKLVGIVIDDKEAKLVGKWKPSTYTRPYVGEGYLTDDKSGKGEKAAIFTPKIPKTGDYEVYISYTPGTNRATNVPVIIHSAEGEKTVLVDQTRAPKVDGLFRLLGKFKFEAGTSGTVTISNKDTTGYVLVDAVRLVPTGGLEKDVEMAMGVPGEVRQKIAEAQARLKELEAEETQLKASAPVPPLMVMAVRDEDAIANAHINVRGNPHQVGDEVPRGFLRVAGSGPPPVLPAKQSGRLELARWLARPDHPLTARVLVNRVWSHLLGEGLVRTVDNFGHQGEKPSHPELLDYLAGRFVEQGWSIKKLIREIMLSRVYQLACISDPALAKADPENRLYGRAQRRRVEAEVIRDAMLLVSGQLDRTMGGTAVPGLGERAIDNDSKGGVPTDGNVRRSVYLPIIRNDVPAVLEVFDFADPEVAVGKRDATTVATQALYLMNSPFSVGQARQTARRLLALPDDALRLRDLYRRALGRLPREQEAQQILGFLAGYKPTGKAPAERDLEAWTSVCLAVFGCTEYRFVE